MNSEHQKIIQTSKNWVNKVVVGLNLCPFAKRTLLDNNLHFSVSAANSVEQLLVDLHTELENINKDDLIETTLLIHPEVLQDFYDYNQFLDYADDLLVQMELDGSYQIASFHPDYQFEGSEPEDVINYTNKSPYPMLHIISEESVASAIASHPDIDQVPLRNQELLKSLGKDKMQELNRSCIKTD